MSAKRNISSLIGIVFLIMAVVTVIPVMWGNDGFNATGFAEAPTYVKVLLPLAVGFGLILLVWSQIPN